MYGRVGEKIETCQVLREFDQGMGANKATVAQVALQVPRAALQPSMTAGAAAAATTVPKVAPAAA